MKLFLKRWLIVAGLSVPVVIISLLLIGLGINLVEKDGWIVAIYLIYISPFVCYVLVFLLSFCICRPNIRQAVFVASTSPVFIAILCWWIWLLIYG